MLAAACTSDAQCGAGLKCLTASGNDWGNGGAANGYCTAECDTSDNSTCSTLTAGAQCIPTPSGNYCMPSCEPGTASASKCRGRADVACDMVTWSNIVSGGVCRPMCRGDQDCDGRKCLLGDGICVDTLPGTDPIGAPCDPDAEETSCASGQCIGGLTDGTTTAGYCTGLCSFGAGGCGSVSPTPASGGDGSCFPVFSGGGAGDLGMCMQTCNCDADCLSDKYVCAQIPGAKDLLGVEGFCFEFDLEIPATSDVVLGIECVERDAGPDATSHADTGVDASPGDAAATSSTAVTSEPTTGSEGTVSVGTVSDDTTTSPDETSASDAAAAN